MKILFAIAALTACIASQAGEQPMQDAKDAAARMVVPAAMYCKDQQDKHAVDYNSCIRQVTDLAAAKALVYFAVPDANANRPAWIATDDDKTLADMVQRWAQSEGRTAKWEPFFDMPIGNPDGVNAAAKLYRADSFQSALVNLLETLRRQYDLHEISMPTLLHGCFYETGQVAVVIRSIDRQCSEPLSDAQEPAVRP